MRTDGRWRSGLAAVVFAAVAGCAVKPVVKPLPEIASVVRDPVAEGASLGRWIRIEKGHRRLVVYDDTRPIRSYPIVLGGDPVGAKVHEGDNRTPEGEYHISAKFRHAEWSRFLLLDYPTELNRDVYEWSRRSGLLSTGRGATPGIGGEVGIHGTVDDMVNRAGQNWTRGCISLQNHDVEELYTLVRVGTRVRIEK